MKNLESLPHSIYPSSKMIGKLCMDNPEFSLKSIRIYIGGMDPMRGLRPHDVLDRLETQLKGSNIQMTDLHLGGCFFQFTTVASVEVDCDPLSTVKSWFHNVTWKGCKLKVEEARPHFLHRLMNEIDTRKQIFQNSQKCVASDTSATLRGRHWRIRRGFAETAQHVDTQPCLVSDWNALSQMMKRHREQLEKLKKCDFDQKKLSFYDRSIHLRFLEEDSELIRAAGGNDQDIPKFSEHNKGMLLSYGDISSDKYSDANAKKYATRSLENENRYVWSDEDSSDKSLSQDDMKSEIILAHNKDGTKSEKSPEQVSDPTNQYLARQARSNGKDHDVTIDKYAWSDDESSQEPVDDFKVKERKNIEWAKETFNEMDEFASGVLQFESDTEGKIEIKTEEISVETLNLEHDVECNLQVLSQLFPELSSVKPVQTNATDSSTFEKKIVGQSGWGQSGQMLRYDPSNHLSTKQFVLETTTNTNDYTANDGEPKSLLLSSETENDKIYHDKDRDQLYEQEKLEKVFKAARDSTNRVVTSITGDVGFSFDFDVATHNNIETKRSNNTPDKFTFEFSVSEGVDTNKSLKGNGALEQAPAVSTGRQNRPNVFPTEAFLDDHVQHFYRALNDGARILDDLDGWRNDATVKAKWLRERYALTQDWKRKRKHALLKQKNRNK